MPNTSIKTWAVDDRPREKMLLKGYAALSNAELLAILINNGTKETSAVDVAKQLLTAVDNDLPKLGKLSVKEIIKLKVKGIGEAKAVSIVAALELGLRRDVNEKKLDIVIQSKDAAEYLRARLKYLSYEVFAVVFLNRANKIKHYEVISEGGITGTVADPKIIVAAAIKSNACSIILCHNHPSGNLQPSKADEEITRKIKEAAKFFDLSVVDHLIVSKAAYFSFAEAGLY